MNLSSSNIVSYIFFITKVLIVEKSINIHAIKKFPGLDLQAHNILVSLHLNTNDLSLACQFQLTLRFQLMSEKCFTGILRSSSSCSFNIIFSFAGLIDGRVQPRNRSDQPTETSTSSASSVSLSPFLPTPGKSLMVMGYR